MLNFKVTTKPTSEPITLAEAKKHLRELSSDQDSLIEFLIQSAREYAEGVTGLKLMPQTITAVCDSFPSSQNFIELPVGPVQSISSISYTDEDSDSNTFADTNYTLDAFNNPEKVVLNPNCSWPSATLHTVNPIKIVYLAGHENAASVPKKIKQAMFLLIGHWYEHREEVLVGVEPFPVPVAAEALLHSMRHTYT